MRNARCANAHGLGKLLLPRPFNSPAHEPTSPLTASQNLIPLRYEMLGGMLCTGSVVSSSR